MSPGPAGLLFEEFENAAEAAALVRPEVDLAMAREVFHEAATLLHNGLVLDGLGDQDLRAVIAGLCIDLVAEDPGEAVRAHARATMAVPGDLIDPAGVSAAYLAAAATLQL